MRVRSLHDHPLTPTKSGIQTIGYCADIVKIPAGLLVVSTSSAILSALVEEIDAGGATALEPTAVITRFTWIAATAPRCANQQTQWHWKLGTNQEVQNVDWRGIRSNIFFIVNKPKRYKYMLLQTNKNKRPNNSKHKQKKTMFTAEDGCLEQFVTRLQGWVGKTCSSARVRMVTKEIDPHRAFHTIAISKRSPQHRKNRGVF